MSCDKQHRFPITEAKFQVKRRLECGWLQADLYVIIIFFENIVDEKGDFGQ